MNASLLPFITKKIRSALAGLTLLFATFSAQADSGVVNVYNWAEYLASDTLPGFTRQTGIKVHYDTFDTNDILQAKLLTGKSGYDIVVPSTHYASRFIQAGLLQKLDKSKFPNWKYLDPDILALLEDVDPGNQYLIPWGMGTDALGYNIDKVKSIMGEDFNFASWENLFDPKIIAKLKTCGVSILDEPAQVFPAVLHYLGKDPNSSELEDYEEAFEVLKKIRPYIRQFSSSGYIDELASGDLCMVYGFNGDVMIAAHRAREAKQKFQVDFFTPPDGAPVFFDTMAITADADNYDNAMAFINYIETPQVHADITNEMFYANANKEARKYVDPELATNAAIYPPPEVSKHLFVIKSQPVKVVRMQTRLWAKLKTLRN
ncbi:polyamine ABC transporter substrate-binding protein [Brackiella oedipodis]|uniref:polyamine ABC transporter substrate-binding protein n=1 Tax=Brackiella oedipodis TaxID=124225 RepID=UPI000685F6B1|nr:polyamine ABC transporter substrate-binding protein [Brackiella oedipodis]